MSTFKELIKHFERTRAYMRDFYLYGFKSRDQYSQKSARSYDDERRRIESWFGDHIRFVRTAEGKNVFLSIDSRVIEHNPLYRAWKARSFTDSDITLHFLLLDLLSEEQWLLLPEILERLDRDYLSHFEKPLAFDSATVRRKLTEYIEAGIVRAEREGNRVRYRLAKPIDLRRQNEALHFFSEVAPCGVLGAFLLDREKSEEGIFGFKHHYITSAIDSDVLVTLFTAMRRKSTVRIHNFARGAVEPVPHELVPLRIFQSVQSGRQHLLAYSPRSGRILPFRVDYLSDPVIGDPYPDFDRRRGELDERQKGMWGVNCGAENGHLERVEFTIFVAPNEPYIAQRLSREKRIGRVERIDETHYRFTADVLDSSELTPWIRSFLCRITQMNFSNRTVENRFKEDVQAMYEMYGLTEKEETV